MRWREGSGLCWKLPRLFERGAPGAEQQCPGSALQECRPGMGSALPRSPAPGPPLPRQKLQGKKKKKNCKINKIVSVARLKTC